MSSNTLENVVDWPSLAQSLVRSLAQQAPNAGGPCTDALEVCAAAFASGFARGRWGRLEVGGVPVDLGAGVLLHFMAWSGLGGERRQELQHLAEGALATYFATWGATLGKRVREGEQLLPLPGVVAELASRGRAISNGSLTEKDSELLQFIRTVVPS